MTYGQDLATVKDAFNYNKDAPILPKNAALHSGSIKWVRGLRERIEAPMEKIRGLSKLVLETEEARHIFEDHAVLLKAMNELEEEHVKAWVAQVGQVRLVTTSTQPMILLVNMHSISDGGYAV